MKIEELISTGKESAPTPLSAGCKQHHLRSLGHSAPSINSPIRSARLAVFADRHQAQHSTHAQYAQHGT